MTGRVVLRFIFVLALIGAILFASNGSLHYWQGWMFLAVNLVLNAAIVGYLAKYDPILLQRRLERRERRQVQKWFQALGMVSWLGSLALSGVDHRFGWSGRLPGWVSVMGEIVLIAGYALIFAVLRANRFAAATIGVEAEQKVITMGPYTVVRHPMYSGITLMVLGVPPALGSWLGWAFSVGMIAMLVIRLQDEERLLRSELPGYAEYFARVKWRLAPGVY
jgi:protein-S-isoprenylcysteine O-methyltransferase Ste14